MAQIQTELGSALMELLVSHHFSCFCIELKKCIGLGHCCLSITDLSSAGQQPIQSDDRMIHTVINGEIYNHDHLQDELARNNGYCFKGCSDSEVVITLYKVFGALDFFQHLRGEFSLMICDQCNYQT